MVFFLGVLCGISITLALIYFSVAYLRYETPKVEKPIQGPNFSKRLFEMLNKRDDWFNYLIAFLYRELCYSDSLHQFAVKTINVELDEIKDNSKKVLQRLELKDYEFGSTIPIFSRFRLTEPEGVDCDVWTDAISIEFDLDYDVFGAQGGERNESAPLQVSAECWPIFFSNSVTVMVKIFKIKGRARLHLTRKPFPFWYISFLQKPELDFRIETNLNNRYSSTIENLFASHMIRMVQRRHTIPNFKLRQSPFFSNDHFNLRKRKGDPDGLFMNSSRTELSITAKRGRGFPSVFSNSTIPSCCFVTFLLSDKDYGDLIDNPKKSVTGTQTENEQSLSQPRMSQSDEIFHDAQDKEDKYDEYVNITVGKNKNIALAEDEAESDIVESTESISPQVGRETKRAKLMGLARNLRDQAKELPVLRNRKKADALKTPDQTSSPRKLDDQPTGGKTKEKHQSIDKSSSLWDIISSQDRFYRTKVAQQANGSYQWRYQTFKAPISNDFCNLLIGVWEKPHGAEEPGLLGIAEIPIDIILLKGTQTLSKTFQRKVKLARPPNFAEENFRHAVGRISSNRGFRPSYAMGDLTLEFGIAVEKEPDMVKSTSTAQTEYDRADSQSLAQASCPEPSSRGRIFGNIRNKFWSERSDKQKNENPLTPPTPKSTQRSIPFKSPGAGGSGKTTPDSDEVEVGTPVDDREIQIMNQVLKYQPGLVAKNQDDMFAMLAKAEGSKLFSELPLEERKFAIEKEMSKIESEIEAELSRKHQMQLDLQKNPDSVSIDSNLRKCAERVNSLATLLMTYTSAMQDTES